MLAVAGVAVVAVLAAGWMFMRGQGPASVAATPPPAVATSPAARRPLPQQRQAGDSEQKLWDRALADKTRQAFQTYLISYPDGVYAQRARDTLLTCRTETNEVWKPGPDVANQMVRGVSGGPLSSGITADQHCSKAKSDVHARAKLMCETIVTNGGYRNAKWTVRDAPCDCQQPNRW